jgi:hypothetical protein
MAGAMAPTDWLRRTESRDETGQAMIDRVYIGDMTDELLANVLEEVEREAAGFPCTDLLWAQVAFLEELQRRRAEDKGTPQP